MYTLALIRRRKVNWLHVSSTLTLPTLIINYMEPRISCDCNKCKGACTVKPGWMLPGEAEKIAEHLGITLQELFDDFLLVDYYLSYQKGHKYLLSPALKGKKPGDMTPSNPMGVCIFFDEETEHCQIHEVAPYECQM